MHIFHLILLAIIFSQIVAAGEDAFIMRYDYIDDETLKEWANWKKKAD